MGLNWKQIKRKGDQPQVSPGIDKFKILQKEEYTCGFCKGSGVQSSRSFSDLKCPVCHGKGIVKVKPPAIKCPYCNGTGERSRGSNTTCPVCGGKGFVSVKLPLQLCPECGGTGTTRGSDLPCTKCGGKGVISGDTTGQNDGEKKTNGQSAGSFGQISLSPGLQASHDQEAYPTNRDKPPFEQRPPEEEDIGSESEAEGKRPNTVTLNQYSPFDNEEEEKEKPRFNMAGVASMAKNLRNKEMAKARAGSKRSYGLGERNQMVKVGKYECGFCGGSGQARLGGTKCPVCGGRGVVSIKPPTVICDRCHGSGRDGSNPALTCLKCKGKGRLHATEEKTKEKEAESK